MVSTRIPSCSICAPFDAAIRITPCVNAQSASEVT